MSFAKEENAIFYHPYEKEEILPTRMITYTANEKLTETISTSNSGLRINAFNTTIVSHELVDGVGTIVFEKDVTSVGEYAFYGCSGLTSIVIPDSVTYIGKGAFADCTSLISINIPDGVTSIGGQTFVACSGLTSVVIGSGVTSIEETAFGGCSGLNEITCNAITAPTINNNTFLNVKSGGILKVPAGSDYSSWMSTNNYYLGKYNWTVQEI